MQKSHAPLVHRGHATVSFLTIIVASLLLTAPQRASAGQAWDVTKYDPDANTALTARGVSN